jgi:hypothetical protein
MEGSVRNVVLLCEGCGGRPVLGGPLSVWHCGSTSFECECGVQLKLSHQLDPFRGEQAGRDTRRSALPLADSRTPARYPLRARVSM